MKRVFSGIQPTGIIHIGNYLGAVKNWVALQEQYDSLFSIVDMHAITSSYFQIGSGTHIAEKLKESTKITAATLLACGVKNIFIQSQIPEHAYLMWIFSCISPMSWFQIMTQFKEKKSALNGASLGLFAYPALMAADILLYKAELVPVGDDQTQHLELARNVASRYNGLFGDFFPIPQPLYTTGTRIMSLRDASTKMSKSSKSELSRINLLDPPDDIRNKFIKAKTDSEGTVKYDAQRIEVANLFHILSELTGKKPEVLEDEYRWSDSLEFKTTIAEVAIEKLRPIREKTEELMKDDNLFEHLEQGRKKAGELASLHIKEIKKAVGFTV